jgi:hypothetical protein
MRLALCDRRCASDCTSVKYALTMICCCRASVSRIVLECTSGLPSMSPPTQVPKRSKVGSSIVSGSRSNRRPIAAAISS